MISDRSYIESILSLAMKHKTGRCSKMYILFIQTMNYVHRNIWLISCFYYDFLTLFRCYALICLHVVLNIEASTELQVEWFTILSCILEFPNSILNSYTMCL
jgi:hypothetical protein